MAQNVTIAGASYPDVPAIDVPKMQRACLTFTSSSKMVIGIVGGYWNGTVEYSTDAVSWQTYEVDTEVTGYTVYFRGTGNTTFANMDEGEPSFFVMISSNNVTCTGNIETLLDYATVENGQHPQMGDYCFMGLFGGCSALTVPPSLPATSLSFGCYAYMFSYCSGLTKLPELPATTLADYCYYGMFIDCGSIKMAEASSAEYPNSYRIPASGTGTTAEDAMSEMFTATGGSFTGDPDINTTYYTSNEVVSAGGSAEMARFVDASGSVTLDANGTYDVTYKASAVVAFPIYDGTVV